MENEIKKRIIELAAGWIGYKEKGRRNYEVYELKDEGAGDGNFTRFGRVADVVISGKDAPNKDGFAWCAMFLLSLMYEAKGGVVDCTADKGCLTVREEVRQWMAAELNGGKPLTYFAGVAAWLSSGKKQGRISSVPSAGDFAIFLKNGKGYHIGLVERVDGDIVTTIEGNTSSGVWDIVANGGCVFRKKRKKGANIVFFKI